MELIKISETNGQKAVSARELHRFLEATERFSAWFERQLQYGFTLNEDYAGCKVFNTLANQELQDFALTIDTAKEISMLAKNEKGKQARQYFIQCEKSLKSNVQNISRIDLARMVIEVEEENIRLQVEAKENAHKVLFTDAVIGSTASCLIGELAKVISQNGHTIGQNRLFDWLRDNGYLGKAGERRNIPNQQYVEQGLFELKKGIRTGSGGELHTTITTKVTGKGQVYFINKFLQNTTVN